MNKEQLVIISLLLDKYTKEKEIYPGYYNKFIDENDIKNIKKELKSMINKE